MTNSTRVVFGLTLIAAGAGVAVVGPKMLVPRGDLGPARAAAEAARKKTEEVLRAQQDALEKAVGVAARVEPLRAALANRVDGPTLVDLFETEDWWRPY